MTLIEAFKKVFIEEIFTVQGRASRKEYWGSELIAFPLIFVVDSIAYFISLSLGDLIYGLTYLWAFIAYTTCSIRRMHDVNRSGWYVLIPIYNLILSINPSDQNNNIWGNPRPHTIQDTNNYKKDDIPEKTELSLPEDQEIEDLQIQID